MDVVLRDICLDQVGKHGISVLRAWANELRVPHAPTLLKVDLVDALESMSSLPNKIYNVAQGW